MERELLKIKNNLIMFPVITIVCLIVFDAINK